MTPPVSPPTTGPKRIARKVTLAKTHVPALDHARKAAQLQGFFAMHAMGNVASTWHLLAFKPNPAYFGELLELQQAAWQRLTALQSTWLRNWAGWMTEADHIQGANTFSKLFEREGDLAARFTELLASQMTDLLQLGETVEVGYRYWVSEKLAKK